VHTVLIRPICSCNLGSLLWWVFFFLHDQRSYGYRVQ
jgi:hypothetical protein